MVDFDVINVSSQQYELLILTSTVICVYTLLLLHHFYKVATIWFLKKEGWHEYFTKIIWFKICAEKKFSNFAEKDSLSLSPNSTNNNKKKM